MRIPVLLLLLITSAVCYTQPYSTANAHSHNDYEQPVPFLAAWKAGFGSIEADIFLENGQLIVAHDTIQLKKGRTLDALYLQPIRDCIEKNKGSVYSDSKQQLLLLIDIKTEAKVTLQKLVEAVERYPSLVQSPSLKIVVSGNRPQPAEYASWPTWLSFDGEFGREYTSSELARIGLVSGNFARYSTWNGKGRIPEKEMAVIEAIVRKTHSAGKKARFWNSPDILNSWYTYMDLGVDYINTDHVEDISLFLKQLPDRTFTNPAPHTTYQPKWRNDGENKPVKNIILLVGDGTGLAQWYAGYTANKGVLNVFNIRHTGLSKTSSFDNYITDSAPGATAFSSGAKTNNRAVGVDHTGVHLELLPVILRRRGMKTGIITSGDLRDATPASFYAHQPERSSYRAILQDLYKEPVDLIMGACDNVKDSLKMLLQEKMDVYFSIDQVPGSISRPFLLADTKAGLPAAGGRGDWSERAFTKAVEQLPKNKDGFFLMLEGAQVDHGGHANKLPWLVTELLDFDKVIGKAMEFADSNGETLIIVTADHETGGLSLTGGDYKKGFISGQFSTGDHTAVPVPVFAYGPRSNLFDGVYENTAIFQKIKTALRIK